MVLSYYTRAMDSWMSTGGLAGTSISASSATSSSYNNHWPQSTTSLGRNTPQETYSRSASGVSGLYSRTWTPTEAPSYTERYSRHASLGPTGYATSATYPGRPRPASYHESSTYERGRSSPIKVSGYRRPSSRESSSSSPYKSTSYRYGSPLGSTYSSEYNSYNFSQYKSTSSPVCSSPVIRSSISLNLRDSSECSSANTLRKREDYSNRVTGFDADTYYSTDTMVGDKYYYKKVKEILEAFPNKGPPYSPTRVAEHIYIGNIRNAEDYSLLQRLGITHVLNLAGTRSFDMTLSPYPPELRIRQFLMLPAEDQEGFDIAKHFTRCIEFLNDAKATGGRALVHCNLGVNRSGAVVAIYIMVHTKKTLLDVINFLKLKRGVILCNRSFRRQVVQFARTHDFLDPVSRAELYESRTKSNNKDKCSDSEDIKQERNSAPSIGHRRCNSEPVANGLYGPTGKKVHLPNGVVTPSMVRPLRMSSSLASVQVRAAPMYEQTNEEEEEDEEEEEYKFESNQLDTLYEEIEQMNMTAPHSSSTARMRGGRHQLAETKAGTVSTIAIHVPGGDNQQQLSSQQSHAHRTRSRRPLPQDDKFLKVPTFHEAKVTTTMNSRPRSMHEAPSRSCFNSNATFEACPNGRPYSSLPHHSSSTSPGATNSTSHKGFFNSLFRRKSSNSSKNNLWRHSVHF